MKQTKVRNKKDILCTIFEYSFISITIDYKDNYIDIYGLIIIIDCYI